MPKDHPGQRQCAPDRLILRCSRGAGRGMYRLTGRATRRPRAEIPTAPWGELGLRTIGTRPPDRAGRSHGINLPLSERVKTKGCSPVLIQSEPKGSTGGTIVGSNGIRMMLGLVALAAFGAAEIAVVYGVVGAIMELTLGVDVPLIGLVDAGDDASSGCT